MKNFWQTIIPSKLFRKSKGYFVIPKFSFNKEWPSEDEDSPRYKRLVGVFNFSSDSKFTLDNSKISPKESFLLCIKYRVGTKVFRYKLWETSGVTAPVYNGEIILKNFQIEIWSEFTENITNSEDIIVPISLWKVKQNLSEADTHERFKSDEGLIMYLNRNISTEPNVDPVEELNLCITNPETYNDDTWSVWDEETGDWSIVPETESALSTGPFFRNTISNAVYQLPINKRFKIKYRGGAIKQADGTYTIGKWYTITYSSQHGVSYFGQIGNWGSHASLEACEAANANYYNIISTEEFFGVPVTAPFDYIGLALYDLFIPENYDTTYKNFPKFSIEETLEEF